MSLFQKPIPREGHPNPDFEREHYVNLNGTWEFCFDFGKSGIDRKLFGENAKLGEHITVPFCPESKLSGIEHKDFIPAVWYRRKIKIEKEDLRGKAFLVFGAADFHTVVYLNGKQAGEHFGGYTSFRIDATPFLREGDNILTVYCEDDVRSPLQQRGKQSEEFASHGCDYTRTTGIWQTVYLEFVPSASYIKSAKYYPNLQTSSLTAVVSVEGEGELSLTAFWDGKKVGFACSQAVGGCVTLTLPLSETHPWEVGKGGLYRLEMEFAGDKVGSWFGLREVKLQNGVCLINGKPVFQRLVLDQGFYPDGIYTAPTNEDLKNDILLSMQAGFNGARLHQKVFEPLFLHYADELGYLVWGEQGSWGLNHTDFEALRYFLCEVEEEIARDFNHPALIGWCPFNETWDRDGRFQDDDVLRLVYRTVKAIDPTRPCIDSSGNYHVETDIYDVHDYEQDPAVFGAHYDKLSEGGELYERFPKRQKHKDEPVFMSEYGGIRWTGKRDTDGWGYGQGPKSEEEFFARYKGLTEAMLKNKRMLGFCYTQLTDVEQEQNGVYYYDRAPKYDVKRLYEINTQIAEIEK